LSLPAPSFFDMSKPEGWCRWLNHFDRFHGGTGLGRRSDKEQIDTFLYLFGPDADEMYKALHITESPANPVRFARVGESVDNFFSAKVNLTHEPCMFLRKKQFDTESAESFIAD